MGEFNFAENLIGHALIGKMFSRNQQLPILCDFARCTAILNTDLFKEEWKECNSYDKLVIPTVPFRQKTFYCTHNCCNKTLQYYLENSFYTAVSHSPQHVYFFFFIVRSHLQYPRYCLLMLLILARSKTVLVRNIFLVCLLFSEKTNWVLDILENKVKICNMFK